MKAIRVDDLIKITECYLYKDSIKEIEGRWYEAEEKAWYIPLTDGSIAFVQLLGAELDDELRKVVKSKDSQNKNNKLDIRMPIRAAPYAHQIEAFNFAMNVYGITSDKDAKEVM